MSVKIAWFCAILSCFAVIVLPIWSILLFRHSRSFEIPTDKQTEAGYVCLITAGLYSIIGGVCIFKIILHQNKESMNFRVHRKGYITLHRQVEMKPLLDDHSDSSERSSPDDANPQEDILSSPWLSQHKLINKEMEHGCPPRVPSLLIDCPSSFPAYRKTTTTNRHSRHSPKNDVFYPVQNNELQFHESTTYKRPHYI